MNFRKISIVIALLVLVGAVVLSRVLSSQKPPAKRSETKERINRVKFRTATNEDLTTQVTVTGRLMSEPRTEIFAEVSGVYRGGTRPFKEGNYFAKGAQLVRMDNTEAKANLLAQKKQPAQSNHPHAARFEGRLPRKLPQLAAIPGQF